MRLHIRNLGSDDMARMEVKPAALKRKYGAGHREFKASLSPENYELMCGLVPTGAGKYGSALINLGIEFLGALLTGEGLVDVARKLTLLLEPVNLAELGERLTTVGLGLTLGAQELMEKEQEDKE